MKNSFRNKDIVEIAHSQLPQAKVLARVLTTYFFFFTDAKEGRLKPYDGYILVNE